MKKYNIIVEVKENGIYFYKPQEIIRVNTKKKMEEVNQKIFGVLQTEEEKEKISKWNNQLIDSFQKQSNINKINNQIDDFLKGDESNGSNTFE